MREVILSETHAYVEHEGWYYEVVMHDPSYSAIRESFITILKNGTDIEIGEDTITADYRIPVMFIEHNNSYHRIPFERYLTKEQLIEVLL